VTTTVAAVHGLAVSVRVRWRLKHGPGWCGRVAMYKRFEWAHFINCLVNNVGRQPSTSIEKHLQRLHVCFD
jgi:hypothetical protein